MTTVKGISKSVTPTVKAAVNNPKYQISEELEKMMKEECKTVKGKFKNYEAPGGRLPFTAGKYPGQPLFSAVFEDGEEYEVPLWVARHLNGIDATAKKRNGKIGSCSYPVHGFKWEPGKSMPESGMGEGGAPVPVTGVQKRVQRVGFESLEFNA
ncbi:MAG: hypothetical protein ACLFUW_00250 [Bacteroidales bacterium]